jgi:ElaB/YqjD/DUF883 family membrane-anchored ribosome-binding protein
MEDADVGETARRAAAKDQSDARPAQPLVTLGIAIGVGVLIGITARRSQ